MSKILIALLSVFYFSTPANISKNAWAAQSHMEEEKPESQTHSIHPVSLKLKNSAQDFYNLGVNYYNSEETVKALASFRKALELDPWQWSAKKALDQMGQSPPFWMLLPYEFFLFLIAVSLLFLVFSFKIWKVIYFILCVGLSSAFWYYRQIPRVTVIQETNAHSAPLEEASSVFSLPPGVWLIQLDKRKDWIQVKDPQQGIGWISESKGF